MADVKKMRVAQVGVGGFGGYRRNTMRQAGLFELVSCYDLNPAAMEAAQKEDGAKPCRSFEEMLDTPGIEGVVVSTGGKFHAEQAIVAANRGYHIFVEKPLCSTMEETKAILAAEKRNKIVAGCGHNDHSHDAHSLTLQRLIDSGELGKIATFEKTTCHNGGMLIKPGDWRGDPLKNPGGMLFQCGVHALHGLMFHFGPITAVSAVMRYDVNPNTGTADTANCLLKFKSGLMGSLNAYHVSPYRHTFSVFGTKANYYEDARYGDEGTKACTQESHLDGKYEPHVAVKLEGQSDICGNVKSWFDAVRNGGKCYPSVMDGAKAVAVVFAAEESAKTGKMIDVNPMFVC